MLPDAAVAVAVAAAAAIAAAVGKVVAAVIPIFVKSLVIPLWSSEEWEGN
jgi:hypothetical protein